MRSRNESLSPSRILPDQDLFPSLYSNRGAHHFPRDLSSRISWCALQPGRFRRDPDQPTKLCLAVFPLTSQMQSLLRTRTKSFYPLTQACLKHFITKLCRRRWPSLICTRVDLCHTANGSDLGKRHSFSSHCRGARDEIRVLRKSFRREAVFIGG